MRGVVRGELEKLHSKELRARLRRMGVPQDSIEDADDKSDLIQLVINSGTVQGGPEPEGGGGADSWAHVAKVVSDINLAEPSAAVGSAV